MIDLLLIDKETLKPSTYTYSNPVAPTHFVVIMCTMNVCIYTYVHIRTYAIILILYNYMFQLIIKIYI